MITAMKPSSFLCPSGNRYSVSAIVMLMMLMIHASSSFISPTVLHHGCFGVLSQKAKSHANLSRKLNNAIQTKWQLYSSDVVDGTAENDENNAKAAKTIAPIFLTLNSSSKWIVTLAQTLAVWLRPSHFQGPFIVVGSILAVYFTGGLKKIINQGRPDGAPFTDPGMPSSHSLVSFFAASAWTAAIIQHFRMLLSTSSLSSSLFFRNPSMLYIYTGILFLAASKVAILRVICGYHSLEQIGVGAVLGIIMGWTWMWSGSNVLLNYASQQSLLTFCWAAYLAGTVLFFFKNIRKWFGAEAKL